MQIRNSTTATGPIVSVLQRIDVLCDVDIDVDYDRAMRFRTLIILSATLVSAITLAVVISAVVSPVITTSKVTGLFVAMSIAAAPVWAVSKKTLDGPGWLLCITSFIGLILACFMNNGVDAHLLVYLPICPAIAGLLISTRAAVAVGVSTVPLILFMGSDLGIQLTRQTEYTPEDLTWMRTISAAIAMSCAIVLSAGYSALFSGAVVRLQKSRDEATRANEAKSQFLANMSHELRTPLNGVVAVAGSLAKTDLDGHQREMADLIVSSGHTLERLVTDVLDVSKIEAGRLELEEITFDLRQTLQSVFELFSVQADNKGIALELSFNEEARGTFIGDPTRLKQVASNLISNALKFTPTGSVRVCVSAQGVNDAQADVTLRVEDTGIGMSPEQLDALFAPFTQADSTINRRFGGTGLGLYICKSIMAAMNGTINVRSTPGAGSVFEASFPLQRDRSLEAYDAQHNARKSDDSVCPVRSASRRLRILLAEDHATNRKIVELILGPLGVDITAVENGEEAILAFETGRFDLILMDMQMPVMDGLSATAAIRRLEEEGNRTRVPIAMLTANAMGSHVEEALSAGADIHISKPVTPDSLITEVVDLMKSYGHGSIIAA